MREGKGAIKKRMLGKGERRKGWKLYDKKSGREGEIVVVEVGKERNDVNGKMEGRKGEGDCCI